MDIISIAIMVGMIIFAIYNLINVIISTPQQAHLEGFEEETHFDSTQGTDIVSHFPVYTYEYKGFRRTFRSTISAVLPFLKKEWHRIYVRKDGKVFELENVFVGFGIALLVFVLTR